jgi:hypothetical protein
MKTPKLVKGLPSLNSKKLSFAETATFIENTPNSVNEESATDEEFVNQNEISQNDQIVVGASQIEIVSSITPRYFQHPNTGCSNTVNDTLPNKLIFSYGSVMAL